ncbi:MAG TPA: energy transducer TonB [Terriglobales bacterium]|jgi:protein TonB|nr:energy transducer TonB [Terriglobales bacterium]
MFADSLLPTERSRRGWTTLASFAIQALGLTVLLALPILYTEGLPQVHLRDLLLTPPPATVAVTAPSHPTQRTASTSLIVDQLTAPRSIPQHTDSTPDLPSAPDFPVGTVVSGVDQGPQAAAFNSLFRDFSRVTPPAAFKPATTAKAPPISRWMEGNLIRKVQPIYPMIAKSAGIQGSVVLRALINRDGKIEQVSTISGPPMLVKAAVDAVSQWLYRPYYLNDQPIEVETQVTVNFVLGH